MRFINIIIAAICLPAGAIPPGAMAEPELSGSPNELKTYLDKDSHTIDIFGYAEETAYSDTAHITLAVVTKAKTLTQALESNARLRQQMAKDLVAQGISADRINNSQFSTSPQYGLFGRKPSQYEVANRLKVTALSEIELTTVSRLTDSIEEVTLANIQFEHSRKEAVVTQVRINALTNAIEKANRYAEAVGLKVKPVWFSPGGMVHRDRHVNRAIEEVVVTAQRRSGNSLAYSSEAPPSISFEELKYTANSTVKFRVVD
ncbi:MAG: SIMPL domain-containing protein [Pseudomonadota bacterium]